jgi:tricorn protease
MVLARLGTAIVLAVVLVTFASPSQAVEPHAGMLRYPDVSQTQIVFRYANDLWLVSREGGEATRLSSPTGAESYAKFSPDGSSIAYMGNYDGLWSIYTLPVTGGVPFRVTHQPSLRRLSDWTTDDRIVYAAWNVGPHAYGTKLLTVSVDGGMPEQLPVPYGTNADIADDGKWMAYSPFARDHASWKRYMGGAAADIWLFHLENHTSRRVTDWDGNDSIPMWHGSKVYYVSDAGENHHLNVWVHDVDDGTNRQVTHHRDYDVRWPSIGPGPDGQGEIVYQLGPELRLLDLESERSEAVSVTIPGDRPRLRPQREDASDYIRDGHISKTGKRVVVEARGDIWTLPAENGSPVNLTRTSGFAERGPSWSPDGKWIAYFGDETGEYELYIKQSDGRGETKKLTNMKGGFYSSATWSPDSKKIAFWDQVRTLYIHDIESGSTDAVYEIQFGYRSHVSWSHDGNWIALADAPTPSSHWAIYLLDLANGETHRVTSSMFSYTWPTFDRDGTYLYFACNRDFSDPTYDWEGSTWVYDETDRLLAIPLSAETASPLLPEIDEEEWEEDGDDEEGEDEEGEDEDGEDEDEDEDAEDEEPEPLEIDLEGFERRAILLPIERGSFTELAVSDEGLLFYLRHGDDGHKLNVLDIEDDEEMEKTVLSGVQGYAMSADGKKISALNQSGGIAIIEAAADQSWDDMVPTSGMTAVIDPREEWRQIFNDAWRFERDYFYDPGLHGVDWPAVKVQYEAMLEDCASRDDLSFIIREMIGELSVGHAYYWGGDTEQAPSTSVGLLACDFELDGGAYKISRIYEGGAWDADARGPLSHPGVDVEVGDYLLAVNGVPVETDKDVWAAFQGLAGRTVTITVSENSEIDDEARHVVIELLSSDSSLRYRAWVEANRAYVAERSDGRVGYVHVPDTGINGQTELVRQFNGQHGLDALIVDERWNGGGQDTHRFIELLNRPIVNYWVRRDGRAGFPAPSPSHYGPKCMLINESAGSGGDLFPYGFRYAGLGKLVGTRTWGGTIGMGRPPLLVDGGTVTYPAGAFYEADGTWGIEGHGVDPDIEVIDDPALMWDGGDPQLDAAIDLMLEEIEANPYVPAPPPPYTNRSGMGVQPEWK